jgi:hypothetical protein
MTPAHEYLDLAQFGLHLVSPEDGRFPALLQEMQARPQPFPPWPTGDLRNAAILLNKSGRAIVVLSFVWRYTQADGTSRSSQYSNLGSSMQMEVLTSRSPVPQDLGTSILAGSKRLLTEQGMFGNNLDVLPEQAFRNGSYMGAGGRAGSHGTNEQVASTQLSLDLAVLDNGLCVGPDTDGVAKTLSDSFEVQRSTAEKVAAAIQNGASDGQIFEMLLPCARQARPPAARGAMLLGMFGRMAVDQLINNSRPEQVAFFQKFAQPPAIKLHRPI